MNDPGKYLQKFFLSGFLAYLAIIPSGCDLSFLEKIPFIKPPAKQVTLTYWGLFEPPEVMQPLIEEYQKEHPNVKIEYEQRNYSSLAQHKETLLTRFREGTGPDIARIHNTWIAQFASELSSVPSDIFSTADFNAIFYPSAADTLSHQDNFYAIPLMYEGLVLYYNTDHFKEANIENPPSDWEEFRTTAVRLTKTADNGNITRSGAAAGTANNVAHFSDILGLIFLQSQVDFPKGLTSRGARDALIFYTNFINKDKVWDGSFPNSVQAFAQGKVSMIFAPSWRYFDIGALNPGLKFKTAAVPQVPTLPRGNGSTVNWASFWAESVNLDSPNRAEAWEFLKFLSQKENMQKLFSEQAKIRDFGEPYSRQDLGGVLLANSILAPLVDGAPTAKSLIIADAAGNDIYVEALAAAIDSVLQKNDIDQALSTLQKTIEQFLQLGTITPKQ